MFGIFTLISVITIFSCTLLKIYLNYRQKKSIVTHLAKVPSLFRATISQTEHQTSGNYTLAKLKLNDLEHILTLILFICFSWGGGINYLNHLMPDSISISTHSLLILIIFYLFNGLINLPFSLYTIFHIEQKFGFNRITLKIFFLDLIKLLSITGVLIIPFLYLVINLIEYFTHSWWILVWLSFIAINLILLIIYPLFIAPWFNKFMLLEDDNLKTAINQLLHNCGFKSSGIFIMDGSRRSTHGNAYFSGIGKTKRIVFFDTLIKKLNPDEIIAVLAHELGHFKYKHTIKQMIFNFTISLILLYLLFNLSTQTWFYHQLGISDINSANLLILFFMLLENIGIIFAPLTKYFSRINEFAADQYAKNQNSGANLINGLIKLYQNNANTLTPDSLYVKFYYTHPPINERIAHLINE